ncbi:hypothetical protein AB0M34_10180 [Nocardia sp. NPDC050193]
MGKAEDAVDKINRHNEPSTWDGVGFQDDQAKDSLDALVGLSGSEFETAFYDIEPSIRERLARESGDLDKEDKYKTIIEALESGDPRPVVTAKNEAAKPEFADGWGWEMPDEKEHLHRVDLYQPKGASAQLISLIEDTEFTMQWGFDTLGARNPEAAPDFTNILDGDQMTSADGWSQLRDGHGDLVGQLNTRKTDEEAKLKDVKVNTEDSAVLNSATFKALKEIKDALNVKLSKDLATELEDQGYRQVDDKIVYNSGPGGGQTYTLYKKGEEGNYVLDPVAEQIYYVSAIDDAAEKWEKEYEKATDKFQQKAKDIDKTGDGDENGGNGNTNHGNQNNNSNIGNNNGGNDSNAGVNNTGTTQNTGQTTDANTALADLDKQFSDILGDSTQDAGATDTTGTGSDGTDPTTASGEDDKNDLKSMVEEYLNGGTGSEGGSGAAQAQQPAAQTASGGGMDMSSMMMPAMMASMLPNMLNRNGGNNNNDKDDDERDEDRRDRDQQAPGPGQQSPGMAATPGQPTNVQPAVAPPTDTGTPPVMSAPGAMVDPKLVGPDGKPLLGPDGKPVQVPPPVAEALTDQKGNPAINASTAYEGTVAAQTPERPWAIVDGTPNTGDVIAWERHSAVLVNNGAGLFYIENGQVVALDQNNLDNAQYGKFQNFLHPSGLDAASATPAAPESPGLPKPTVTQSQPPAPPAVQAPKEPQAT